MKIASLLPSATEIVISLGLEKKLVGRSHECDMTVSIQDLPVLTEPGMKFHGVSEEIDQSLAKAAELGLSVFKVNVDELSRVNPDVILTQDHCEVCAIPFNQVQEAVDKFCFGNTEIISLSPTNLDEVMNSIRKAGEALNREKRAKDVINELELRFNIIRQTALGEPSKSVLAIEWIKPLMTAGNWVPELIEIAGGDPILADFGKHSPKIKPEQILEADPDIITVVPCGYSMDETVTEIDTLTGIDGWNQLRAVNQNQVYILDGNRYFNRPGPGIYESARILGEILHPNLFKPEHEDDGWIHLSAALKSTN
ncbi:MAG: ABC transporter substrate-binding protein [Bacteroidetes bacterium]|jgi:iron complex transport system substrate-binding protein|nr:ABC transporter substrate-binding protein [Bacteroidota bacterium]